MSSVSSSEREDFTLVWLEQTVKNPLNINPGTDKGFIFNTQTMGLWLFLSARNIVFKTKFSGEPCKYKTGINRCFD